MLGYRYLLISLFFVSGMAFADIYRSVDEHGNVVFSDRSDQPSAEKIKLQTGAYRYRVRLKRVIDGDTLELESGEKIRLIGINTPEVANRFSDAQPGGVAAKNWLKTQLRSPELMVEYDQQQYDKYDRRLAHCFLENGDYLNAGLLKAGHAMLTLTPPNLRYAGSLIAAQTVAEDQGVGIWSLAAYQPKTLESFTPGSSYRGWQRWQVTAKAISQGKRVSKLIVSEHLAIQIANEHLALFEALEHYIDKPIEVRGWVSRRGDQHTIKLVHPSAIILL